MMKIKACDTPAKCDFVGCKNAAKYCFVKKGFLQKNFALCQECMDEMYACISKVVVPKAIDAPYKRNKKESI